RGVVRRDQRGARYLLVPPGLEEFQELTADFGGDHGENIVRGGGQPRGESELRRPPLGACSRARRGRESCRRGPTRLPACYRKAGPRTRAYAWHASPPVRTKRMRGGGLREPRLVRSCAG